jgi:hypothetical protein
MVVRAEVIRANIFSASVAFLLLAAAVHAQTLPAHPSPPPVQASPQPKPVTGFVSSYEILRTVRAAGFDPLSPPLREGTSYVLRATDFRGILMRVVLDARTGVIRDVTRIVPAMPGPYGMIALPYGPPPYASLPYGPPPYGSPAEHDAPTSVMRPGEEALTPLSPRRSALPTATRPAGPVHLSLPPLPRPRPPALASQRSEKTGKVEEPAGRGAVPASSAAPDKLAPIAPLND